MSGSGDTEDSLTDTSNPFLPVSYKLMSKMSIYVTYFQIIGFKNAKTGVNDHPENVPYGLTDLTAAVRTTLRPLMVGD